MNFVMYVYVAFHIVLFLVTFALVILYFIDNHKKKENKG